MRSAPRCRRLRRTPGRPGAFPARAGGLADHLDADLRDTGRILDEASRRLDFGRPVALMLTGILGDVESDDEAKLIIKTFMDRLPSEDLPHEIDQFRAVRRKPWTPEDKWHVRYGGPRDRGAAERWPDGAPPSAGRAPAQPPDGRRRRP